MGCGASKSSAGRAPHPRKTSPKGQPSPNSHGTQAQKIVDMEVGVAADLGHNFLQAFRRVGWKVGGEHQIFDRLRDGSGFVGEENLRDLLGQGDATSVKQCMQWLDADGDGQVCEADLDARVTSALFAEQFRSLTQRSGELFLEGMSRRIPRTRRGKPASHVIMEMSDEEMRGYAEGALEDLLHSLRGLRSDMERVRRSRQTHSGVSSKFCFQPEGEASSKEFLFGPLAMFKQGLEKVIGIPAADIREAMEREHLSTKRFTTGNYGVSTFDRQEFDLIDKGSPVDYAFDSARQNRNIDQLLAEFQGRPVLETLTREEVVALVLYTGPMFERYNRVLREVLFPVAQKLQAGEDADLAGAQVEFVTTIHMTVSGILKLSELTSIESSRKVYRGLRGKRLPESFTTADGRGCRGGTELGFMSTTTKLEVAKAYADLEEGRLPTVFEIETGQVDRGASLAMLSQYPGEQEVLLPPLCNLEVTGDVRVEWEGDLAYWLVPMRVSVNLKSRTRDQHEERRKLEVLGQASNVLLDTKQALLARMQGGGLKSEEEKMELYEALLGEGRRLVERLREGASRWFNDDKNFGMALQDLVHVRSYSTEVMDAFLQDDVNAASYYTQYSMTMWHRLNLAAARLAYEAREAGGDAGKTEAASKLAVLEGLISDGAQDEQGGMDGDTALIAAAAAGNVGSLRVLAAARCDVNATNARQCTALHAAVVAGHAEAARVLVELGADAERGKVDTAETALHQAAEFGRPECVRVLLAAGARVCAVGAGTLIGQRQPLHEAVVAGQTECAALLVEAGADVEARDAEGWTPMIAACKFGHIAAARLLREAQASVEVADTDGDSCVHLAAMGGHVETLQWLLECEADPGAVNNDGDTPMHTAVLNGHVAVFRALQAAGCKVDATNNIQNQPVHLAAMESNPELLLALVEARADPAAVNEAGSQPLHMAAIHGCVEVMACLRKFGVDASAANNAGEQAMHLAAADGQVAAMRMLVEEWNAEIHAGDADGDQPLARAAMAGEAAGVEWLLSAKADVEAANSRGYSALLWAAMNGHLECAKALRRGGASVSRSTADGDSAALLAALEGKAEMLRWLRDEGADLAAANGVGNTGVHLAALNGHTECVAVCVAAGGDLRARNEGGNAPLHLAAMSAPAACLPGLLEAGAEVEAENETGDRAAHWAAHFKRVEWLEALAHAGASLEAANSFGNTPLHVAAIACDAPAVRWLLERGVQRRAVNGEGNQAVHLAAAGGGLECMEELLRGAEEGFSAENACGDRPLHLAAMNDRVECAERLLAMGADVRAENAAKSQPAHLAATGGHLAMLRLLHEAGGDTEAADKDGDRCLHLAAGAGRVECVRWLCEAQADVSAANGAGLDPLQVAQAAGAAEVVAVLAESRCME